MLFERITSEGLAHYSYLIGHGQEAVVIDPRRDVELYVELAHRQGMRIIHALETHRHEDFISGSLELASRTDAAILRSADLAYYGQPAQDGQSLPVGKLRLQALHTPGHTPGHVSYLLYDAEGAPWALFSGDALFAGEVGRVDLFGPERTGDLAGQLHDSLFRRILPLGDGLVLCPAHGAGSSCGAAIAHRPWTTIGLERQHNPRLRPADRASFVDALARPLEYPPYFRAMEQQNKDGPSILGALPAPPPLPAREFAALADRAQVLDVRMVMGFGAAHIPGALSIWEAGVPSFAGWFLSYERPILLVGEGNDLSPTVRHLVRLGFDRLEGYLAGGMLAWHKAGLEGARIDTVTVQELCRLLDQGLPAWILDVRSASELAQEGRIPGAHHVHVTQLPGRLGEVPRDLPVFIFCGSGLRSMIAASLLRRAGWQRLTVVLGGFAGWRSARFPIERAEIELALAATSAKAAGPSDLR
ncbi:MAG: MBL fold metallo-hydrolase [Anaerolineae bacterium]|nr:MBL fold metallo-hydrolase [Anaerolineae bacterium]